MRQREVIGGMQMTTAMHLTDGSAEQNQASLDIVGQILGDDRLEYMRQYSFERKFVDVPKAKLMELNLSTLGIIDVLSVSDEIHRAFRMIQSAIMDKTARTFGSVAFGPVTGVPLPL